ncbi:MAG: metalloregulator ArsR/SmtB family transcription factor [Candidatus Devosia phytovorans]|uniref:Metalloregulator ArsR/SmtB family transcription factor n=1 Tax=Candidatus Devosia phytovorans TaxID=3121372 RepID=A0AAJ6B2P6_9HYPH|nr:metalloregulator ArsR/SmtB family transcription factor [Devosia sp.]WEK06861.1 MAG: metalloregulator ArsR/SmtB family transcription factor [Devosia sp.]
MPDAQFDRLFQALADPYRRGFVERLARGPASVSELAAPAKVGLPAVLKHLRILEEGGIVVSVKHGRIRTYRMQADGLAAINAWIAQRQAEMNRAFDRLEALMAEVPEEGEG